MSDRFEVRRDGVHSFWSVWDNVENTWFTGIYDDKAYYAAGVPSWRRREDAEARLAGLPSADDIAFARETLGPDASDDEVLDLANLRLDRDSKELMP